MDREEGGLRYLEENSVNKAKQNPERACNGGGWITVLTRYQDGNDISWDYFRDVLQWNLDKNLQKHPLACDGCNNPFMV